MEAAILRNIADIVNKLTKLKRKKMKNCDGSVLNPAKKYKITLKPARESASYLQSTVGYAMSKQEYEQECKQKREQECKQEYEQEYEQGYK